MPAAEFRPRTISELLDATFHLWRAHLVPLGALCLVRILPAIPLLVISNRWLGASVEQGTQPQLFGPGFGSYLLFFAIGVLLWIIIDGALVLAAADAYLGEPVAAGRALSRSARRAAPLIGATLLAWAVAIVVMLVAGVVVGIVVGGISVFTGRNLTVAGTLVIILAVAGFGGVAAAMLYTLARYFAVPEAVLLEGRDAIGALSRSLRLSHGAARVVLAVLVVTWIVTFIVALPLSLLANALVHAVHARIAAQLVGQVIVAFVYPVVPVGSVVLYFDMRIRKEGYDLELMARALPGSGAAAPGAPAAPDALRASP